jgi:hypothetical protein
LRKIGTRGPYDRAIVLVKLNGYKFHFHHLTPYFILDPKFTPYFWKLKGDDDDTEMGKDKDTKHAN